MKKKRNLKQRMLIRENNRKLKDKIKKLTCLSAVAVMVAGMINPQTLVYATSTKNTNQILENKVEYNEDYSKASIQFDVDSVDKEKYELISITSDKENTVIYDKDKIIEEDKSKPGVYETVENGSYSFTVKYTEKHKEEITVQDVEESIKETEVKINTKEETSNVPEETVEISKKEDTSKSVDEQKETELESVSEVKEDKAVVETVKEEKVLVDITEIKKLSSEFNTRYELEEAEKDVEISDGLQNDKTVIDISNSNDILELGGNFSIASWKSDSSNQIDLSSQVGNTIVGNKMKLTTPEQFSGDRYVYQTTSLTYNKGIDIKRPFIFKGSINVEDTYNYSSLDGIAVAIHKEKDYKYKGGYASNMGIYNCRKPNGLNSPAIVAEIDAYENNSSDAPMLGDRGRYGDSPNTPHLAIQTMNDNRTNPKVLKRIEISDVRELIGKNSFIYIWEPSKDLETAKLTLSIGDYNISYDVNLKEVFGNDLDGTTITFGAGSGLYGGSWGESGAMKPLDMGFEFEGIKYIDFQPEITTTVEALEYNYAIPEETVRVTHKIWNGKSLGVELNDVLNLSKMKIDDSGEDLNITNVKMGTDLNNLIYSASFDKNTPLNVKYPANSKPYYVQYDVTIPNLKNYGNINHLNYEVLLGQKGMSQIPSEGSFEIKNNPALYAKKDNSPIVNSQIIKVATPTEVTKELMWEDLYAKVALASSNEYKINVEDSGTDNMQFKWEYQVNGNKVEAFPEQVEKGNIYSLKLKVTDKSDARLSNEFNRTVIIEEDIVQADDYYIYAEDSKPISETKLVTLTQDEFKNYVKTESKVKAFKINSQTGLVENKEVEVKLDGWLDRQGEPYHLPGTETIEVYVTEKPTVKKLINQEVTKNTWSYDTKDRKEENGASGFIVIPKGVNLESGTGNKKDKLVGNADIYFANYTAEDVLYDIYVDKTFELVKDGDSSSKFTVTSVGRNAGIDNKMRLGEINYRYKQDRPLRVKFEAPRTEVDKSKGRWKGNVRFYFERVS